MGRVVIFIYGIACYVLFFLTFLYLIAFVGNLGTLPFVTKTIDSGTPGPLGQALLVNLSLIALFAVTHTVMARPWFKEKWTKIVPPAAERSTYVLVSSLALILLYREWVPMTDTVWNVTDPAGATVLWVLYFAGYGIVLVSTLLINHFHLFGLSQVFAHLRQSPLPGVRFVEPVLYKVVRHPLYVGWIMAFWATPNMTSGHLLFAAGLTAQILISIPYEERDIEEALGQPYRDYKGRTPMLVPFLKSRRKAPLPDL
ncbi:MAG: NnrU family protein [Alphaproteobacteria bacterium]|nr:NnrU family protein [Alphaproteobacteria bacterium]